MDDVISRQAAVDAVVRVREHHAYDEIEELNALPSAQPERKRGRWIDETFKPWGLVHHPYRCSLCGEHAEYDSMYCPNCGAKMEVEHDTDR